MNNVQILNFVDLAFSTRLAMAHAQEALGIEDKIKLDRTPVYDSVDLGYKWGHYLVGYELNEMAWEFLEWNSLVMDAYRHGHSVVGDFYHALDEADYVCLSEKDKADMCEVVDCDDLPF